jgi:hypothetical protein
MSRERFIAGYRIAAAVLGIAAVIGAIDLVRDQGTFDPVNFFSFFTIQSNLLAIMVLLYGGLRLLAFPRWDRRDLLRGATVLYLSLTGIVYALLLAGEEEALQTGAPWVNAVVHGIIPLVMVLDWVIDPPRRTISFRQAAWWLAYPLAFLAYSLIRGPIADWYPYPFLDPDENGGYPGVLATCLAIAAGVLVAISVMVWLSQRHWRTATATA